MLTIAVVGIIIDNKYYYLWYNGGDGSESEANETCSASVFSFAGNGELTLSDLITMLQVQRSYAMTQRGAWAQGYTAKVVVYIRNIIINGNG